LLEESVYFVIRCSVLGKLHRMGERAEIRPFTEIVKPEFWKHYSE